MSNTNQRIASNQIQDGAVTEQKLVDGAVSTAKLQNLSVTSGKIDNLAVVTEKVADYAIQREKLHNNTKIMYSTGEHDYSIQPVISFTLNSVSVLSNGGSNPTTALDINLDSVTAYGNVNSSNGDMYASGNKVATESWVTAQNYITEAQDNQTLSWNGSTGELTISGTGNTVDLDGRYGLLGSSNTWSGVQTGRFYNAADNTNLNFFIRNGTGAALYISQTTGTLTALAVQSGSSAGSNINFTVTGDGDIATNGSLSLIDSEHIYVGTGNDLDIYHNGSNTYVTNATGALVFTNSTANHIQFGTNGSTRWIVDGSGHLSPYVDSTYDIGSNANRVKEIFADKLNIGTNTQSYLSESTNDFNIVQNTNSAGKLVLSSLGSVQVDIDSNNNDTDKTFVIQTNGSAEVFSVNESAEVRMQTVIITDSSGNDKYKIYYDATSDSLVTEKI